MTDLNDISDALNITSDAIAELVKVAVSCGRTESQATIASLTIQRDAAEALARERLAELQAAPLARALDTVEALAILRDFVHGQHDEAPSMRDLLDRARKLVGTP